MTGTPTASRVPRLREKRLIAILVSSGPNTGSPQLELVELQPPLAGRCAACAGTSWWLATTAMIVSGSAQ